MSHSEQMLRTMLPNVNCVLTKLDMLNSKLVEPTKKSKEYDDRALSHDISRILRHDEECMRAMDAGGRVSVQWLVDKINKKDGINISEKDIERVVLNQDSENMRYAIDVRGDNKFIFCFQGHDLKFYSDNGGPIQLDVIYTKITSPCEAIHSTKLEYVKSIMDNGLKFALPGKFQKGKKQPAGRFVHLWNRANSAKKGRSGSTAWIYVDMEAAMAEDGIDFYAAGNGVILATKEIPRKYLKDITDKMNQAIDNVSEAVDDEDTYVSWKNVEDQSKWRSRFAEDLLKGAKAGSQASHLLLSIIGKEASSKRQVHATVYECVQLNGLYIVMVNGKNDFQLEDLAKHYGFPRGLPVLWKPDEFIDIRGFHPKFPNDSRDNQTFNPNLLNDARSIQFFLKWSGFLLHVLAFEYQGKYYWTVCTKKVAFRPDVPYFQWGHALLEEYMRNESLIADLAKSRTYIGVEALCVNDVHGYIVKRDDFVVTCVSQGSYVNLLDSSTNIDQKSPNGATRLVVYKSVDDIALFCIRHQLPFDTGYRILLKEGGTAESLKSFAAELFEERDTMKCRSFRRKFELLEKNYVSTLDITRLSGSKSHEAIVGDTLEGFVLNIAYDEPNGNTGTRTYKVKLPYYTWRTLFLRTWMDSIFRDQEETFIFASPPSIPIEAESVISQNTATAIQEYVSRWCCTPEGRNHFETLCRAAVMTTLENIEGVVAECAYAKSNFSTGKKFKERLHVLVADFVENDYLTSDEITHLSSQFRTLALKKNIRLSTEVPTIFVCVGPVGYGKSISALRLAKDCHDLPVDVIDGDLIAGGDTSWTYALGDERNPMTLGAIWKSIMAGRIPLLTVGGGQIVEHKKDEKVCALRKYAMDIFGCEINLVAAVMEDVSDGERNYIKDVTDSKTDLAELITRIYDVPLKNTTAAIESRIAREEIPKNTDINRMQQISLGNREPALAILKEANRVFTIPCRCTAADPDVFINECVKGWTQIVRSFTAKQSPMPGRFTQLRAIVFKKGEDRKVDEKAGHITLFYQKKDTSSLSLSHEQLDKIHLDILALHPIKGKRCKLVLPKIPKTEETNDFPTRQTELTTGIEIEQESGTTIIPFETRTVCLTQELAKEDVTHWSMDEVMNYKLTRSMYTQNDFTQNEEKAVYERKKAITRHIAKIQQESKNTGNIEAVYLPTFNDLLINKDRVAHVTLSSYQIQDRCSDAMIRWFLAEKKPDRLVLAGRNANDKYELTTPRSTRDYKVLVNDNKISFHSADKAPLFRAGDLLEKMVTVEGNCFLDEKDTEFIYVGLVPMA